MRDRRRRLALLVAGALVASVIVGFGVISLTWTAPDTDGDGIPDCQEASGMRSMVTRAVGNTDPQVADTDGDGVVDGEELVVDPASTKDEQLFARPGSCPRQKYSALSDPALPDTDRDLLNDAYELSAGSDAFASDSDGDGLSDGRERGWGSDPNEADTDGDGFRDSQDVTGGFAPVIVEERIDADVWASEFREGVIAGDAIEVDSVAQLLGSIAGGASSSLPVVGLVTGTIADVRDFVANAVRGDWVAAGAAGAGIVPYVGDTARASRTVLKFAAKYPDKVNAVVRALASQNRIPVSVRVQLLGVANPSELDKLRNIGLSDDVIVKFAKRGALLTGLVATLSKATERHVIPREYTDDDGFVRSFADAESALRDRARQVNGAANVSSEPVYIGGFPQSFRGGRLVDVCTNCSPQPLPRTSTFRVVKVGAQLLSDTLQGEIDKDAYLRGEGYAVEWHFFAGRTGLSLEPRLLDALDKAGIPYYLHLPG